MQATVNQILDYFGYVTVALMVVLAVVNLLVIADKMSHRTGIVERMVKRAAFYIGVLRFGGGAKNINGHHLKG
ncbi:hypothetical protein CV770_26655 [Bradyrhizobium sp. AC87j1]|uniref:hypothetical protein n=1 Tax=Bradyrhizobium sp. AC87j1 TaxID=2055894 RepID=UPI000CEC9033|nr:hypothetical protein [Bradyrhizobium sp. AC87j1]PPQ16329.1 hypothetical protein CV770_26655 [Bradyrhizobium sp. AC87j1]